MEPVGLQVGAPTYLGDWHVISKLGDGGMGSVYLGRNGANLAALKTLHPAVARTASASERFRREYAAAQAIHSPHVAPVIDEGLQDPIPYLAFRYIEGPTLDEYVRTYGVLRGSALASFGRDLAEGLSAIHAAGVVHRDLKPSNVVLTDNGPVIIDFGIALMGDVEHLTATNQIVGSPGWIAPEQIQGDPVGPATDVFGWGAVMHFAATGENPFGSGNSQALLYRIVHGAPHPHGLRGPLGDAITSAMQRNAAQRAAINELIQLADDALAAPPGDSRPRRFMSTAAGTTLISIAAVAALVLVGAVIFARFGSDTSGPGADAEDVPPGSAVSATGAADAEGGGGADDGDALIQTRPSRQDEQAVPAVVDSTVGASGRTIVTIGCGSDGLADLGDVNISTIGPGDGVRFVRGCRFLGPIDVLASGTESEPITVSADGAADEPLPIIENDGREPSLALMRIEGNHIHVSDLRFRMVAPDVHPECDNTPKGWIVGVSIAPGSHHNRIESIQASGGYAGVFLNTDAYENTIVDSDFEANVMMNDISGANGVLLFGANDNVVTGNRFRGHITCHPEWSSSSGSGVSVFGGRGNVVSGNVSTGDNTFVALDGILDGEVGGHGGTRVENNVVVDALIAVTIRPDNMTGDATVVTNNSTFAVDDTSVGVSCNGCAADAVVVENNIVWAGKFAYPVDGAVATAPGFGESNLYWHAGLGDETNRAATHGSGSAVLADPLFRDAEAGDLSLDACSPAIRPSGPAIGAHDYEGPPCA